MTELTPNFGVEEYQRMRAEDVELKALYAAVGLVDEETE